MRYTMARKKPTYFELDEKLVIRTKALAKRLQVPMVRVVEMALKEFIKSNPQLELKLENPSKSK